MPKAEKPQDLHEWISFEDPDEHRTWLFDATFLRSNFTCIYGAGCKGTLDQETPELMQGCCSYGAHFEDEADVQNVARHFERVRPRHMQYHADAVKHGFWTDGEPSASDGGTPEPTVVSRLADDACIFLNRPGFEGGVGCALHIAALEAGERPLDWKPRVCWQVPIRMEDSTDESGHVTTRIREWKRRDWGDGGDDFAWWCTESPDAFVGSEPLYRSAEDDLVALVGRRIYRMMVAQLERSDWVPLEHPVVRRQSR